jgi:hypothetical protein
MQCSPLAQQAGRQDVLPLSIMPSLHTSNPVQYSTQPSEIPDPRKTAVLLDSTLISYISSSLLSTFSDFHGHFRLPLHHFRLCFRSSASRAHDCAAPIVFLQSYTRFCSCFRSHGDKLPARTKWAERTHLLANWFSAFCDVS